MQPDGLRIRLPDREDLDEEARAAYDLVKDRVGMNLLWQVMANSPAVGYVAPLAAYLVGEAPDRALNELVISITAGEAGCELEHAGHTALAKKFGVPEETLAKVGTPEIDAEPFPYG